MSPENKLKLKAVIFDFDGTIADSLIISWQVFNKIAANFDLPELSDADVAELRNFGAKEILKKYNISYLKLLSLTKVFQTELKKQVINLQPIAGITTLLQEISSLPIEIGVVTSNSKQNVQAFLQAHKLMQINFIHAERNLFGKARVLRKVLNQHNWQAMR